MREKLLWILEDDQGSEFVFREILGLRYSLQVFHEIEGFSSSLGNKNVKRPDLLIADLRLPGESFISFLSRYDKPFSIPFMVVSSVDDVDALRFCFEKGAVDYITKPFGKSELVVKLERFFDKRRMAGSNALECEVDITTLRVLKGSTSSVPLTTKELQIFQTLLQASGHSMTREELIQKVWSEIQVGTKTLDVHLFHLRQKLQPVGIQIVHRSPGIFTLQRS